MNHPKPAATYIEVLLLDDDAYEVAKAHHIGRALITPCHAADAAMDDMQRLRFWTSLIAYMLGVAESAVGPDGRLAIVQCMRAAPPTHQQPRAVQ